MKSSQEGKGRIVFDGEQVLREEVEAQDLHLVFEKQGKKRGVQNVDPLLSPKQAAAYLGVSPKFIYERTARREIAVQPVGRLRRIRLSAIEAWLLRQNKGA